MQSKFVQNRRGVSPDKIKGRFAKTWLRPIASFFSLLALGAITAPHAALAAPPQMGINIGGVDDWNNELLFADAMMESRTWDDPSSGSSLPVSNLDANGWPNRDAQIYVWAGSQVNMAGTYKLSFSGKATVTLLLNGGTITGQTYNSTTNVTTATLTLNNSDCQLRFTNTQQNSTAATNTGIKNVSLMRPTTPGATTSYAAGTLFTTQVKNLIAKFSTIRFMDYLATNASPLVNWSERTRPTFFSQQRHPNNQYGDHVTGGALEYAVMLGNQTGKDIWINIPLKATDDYITKVAQLIRYGSDGTNPYTTTQTSPVYPPLDPSLNVYVEYANEVWNTAGPFDGNTNHTLAQQEVAAGGSPLNFDGDTNDWDWAWRRTAKRGKEISDIFRTVWGNSNMMTRVRPVLETQLGYPEGPLLQAMHLMQDYYNTSRAGTPHPPSYYFYGGGGSAYYSPDNSGSWDINSVWTSATYNTTTWLNGGVLADVNYIVPSLGRRIAYEGGPSMDRTGASVDSLKEQVWGDSRMTTTLTQHQTTWDQSGGDLLVYYQAVGDYQWGFTHDINNLSTPKLTGINNLNATTKPVGTNGTAIPATLTAGSYGSPATWVGANPGNLSATGNWTWLSYTVKASTASGFNIALHAGSAGAGNTAEIYVDGVSCGTISIPNTGANSTYTTTATVATPTLSAGTHGIVVKARNGSFGYDQVLVTTGSASQVAAPAFSPGGGTYTSAQSVAISSTTAGASIRYTTDGSTPTSTSGNVYSSAVGIGSTSTLKAIAYKSGSTDSSVTSAVYTINISNVLPVRINAGGGAVTPFVADNYSTGGTTATNWTGAIDTSGVTGPAPSAVYQSERYGASTYTIPGLSAGTAVKVRLHFCENYFTAANQRKFNVAINGGNVLSDFDIFAAAGAIHKAVVREFTVTVNASGQVIIAFTNGSVNNALINGIEIVSNTSVPATVTLNPTDDTDTQSDVAAGTNPTLNASMYNTIFARFDFTAVTGTVTSAKFRIYKEGASSGLVCITSQGTTDSWVQSNRSALPGIGSTIQSLTSANTAGYIEFDVTAFVQSRMSGSKLATFAFTTNNSGWYSFTAKEGSNKPQLVITTN